MKPPLVSVVVAAFNREKTIGQAIDSVLAQTGGDYELIVVDDGSTDRTLDILAGYGSRMRVIRRGRNSGLPSVARNAGMAEAQGRYIAFLDSDDYWYPAKLEKQVGLMETRPDVALSHTFCHVVDENARPLYVRREKEMPVEGDLFERLIRECFITTSTVMIRKEVLARTGGFDEHPELQRGEDQEFFLRVARDGRIGFVPEVLAAHRKFPGNISGGDFDFQQSILRTQQYILKHATLWRGRVTPDVPLKAYIDACTAFSYYWQAKEDSRKARFFAVKAWGKKPYSLAAGLRLLKTCVKREWRSNI